MRRERIAGEITFLDFDKGFGFIKADGQEFFFHAQVCDEIPLEEMQVGWGVTFEPSYSNKGPRALKVRREEGARKGSRG